MYARVDTEPLLVLPGRVRAEVVRLVEQGHPLEVCGLLEGKRSEAAVEVTRAIAARNVAPSARRDHYEIAPEDFLRADARARAAGRELVGVWHSHPNTTAVPSAADRAAAWPEYCYLIAASTDARVGEVRSWFVRGGVLVEQRIAEATP